MKNYKEVARKIREKADDATTFVGDHLEAIACTVAYLAVFGLVVYMKGYCSGVRCGRKEWDFDNEDGEWFALMDDRGELRTILPGSGIKELLENHKGKPITDEFWKF